MKGPKNKPIIVYNLAQLKDIYGEPDIRRRSLSDDKDWMDAYQRQIVKMLSRSEVEEMTNLEVKILQGLLKKYFNSAWSYIFRKHCE